MDKPLIVRYQMLCDDRSGDVRDELRLAELVCSLTSLKLYVAPYLPLTVVIYSLQSYMPRLQQLLDGFLFSQAYVVDIAQPDHAAFAETIRHCTPVDRICIRRMLADFSLLPTDQYRLLLGTDVFFQKPPAELLSFVAGSAQRQVLYMADVTSFQGKPYRLTYHRGKLLAGLLGDFYCLAPGVMLGQEAIQSCLRTIDAWPPRGRWDPHPVNTPLDYVHACEQQAAAILLADYSSEQLPIESYHHGPSIRRANASYRLQAVLHAHAPWTLALRRALSPELVYEVREYWSRFGMKRALREASWPVAAIYLIPGLYKRVLRRLKARLALTPQL